MTEGSEVVRMTGFRTSWASVRSSEGCLLLCVSREGLYVEGRERERKRRSQRFPVGEMDLLCASGEKSAVVRMRPSDECESQ